MGVRRSFIILIYLLASLPLLSQEVEVNYQQEYLKGKDFFRQGRFGLAQDTFEKLTIENEDNPFVIYSSFYYSLCAYQQGYMALARDMLLQVKTRYPDWNQIDEVNYWLAIIYFENGQPERAIKASQDIIGMESEAEQMQRYYLQQINGLDTMMVLLDSFPESYPVAEQTAWLIGQQNLLERDLDLLDSLSRQFDLPFLTEKEKEDLMPKDLYKISILFPFLSGELKPDLGTKVNQFVLDLYQGIMLAADTLNKTGSTLEFTLFDTQRDTSVVKEFLTDNRLRESDLIMGPLFYPEMISQFAYDNRINVLHPYLKEQQLIDSNSYFFTYSALPRTVGKKAAELVLADTTLRTGIMFYGESERDSIMAIQFRDAVDSSLFQLVLSKKILIGSEREALEVLTTGTVVNKIEMEEIELTRDSIDLIYIASNNPGGSVYANILTGVEARGDSIPVLGSRNYIEDNVISKRVLENLGVTMTTYDLINTTDSSFMEFSDRYLARYGVLPSKFASVGYDMMMYFGSSLQKYGKYFQLGLRKEGFRPGYISYGFDYSDSNSNGVVPVIRWDGEKMIFVDRLKEKEIVEETDEETEQHEK